MTLRFLSSLIYVAHVPEMLHLQISVQNTVLHYALEHFLQPYCFQLIIDRM